MDTEEPPADTEADTEEPGDAEEPLADTNEPADRTCAICLEQIGETTDKHTLAQCGHEFHASCLLTWTLASNNGRSCPTCRASPPQLGYMTCRARASYLRRTVARRKNAPAELLRLVKRVQAAEAIARQTSRHLSEIRREHSGALKVMGRARTARWRAQRKVSQVTQMLGCFSCAAMPLPGLLTTTRFT